MILTATALLAAYRAKETTPAAYVGECLARIQEDNAEINAFLDVYTDQAIEEAAAATQAYQNGEVNLPLLGVPIAIKHNILYAGHRATAGSKILENYVASYDATVVARLRASGAIIIGGTNMDEFAMGGSTENSAFGITRNPRARARVPGGSSGGSAAAVAMGAVPVAIGTDTGGSIRQPASYCGLVGLKPTYGAVSRFGLIAMGSSLDQAGPLANSVADAELIHYIISGTDPHDATTITDTTYPIVTKKEQYRIGVPRSFLTSGVDQSVLDCFEKNLEHLASLGHTIVDIDLPLFERGLAAYYIVMPAEVSSNTARYDGMRYGLSVDGNDLGEVYTATRGQGFGAEVKRRILLGTHVLSSGYYDAYYGKAERLRALMRAELATAFADVDIITTPTAPTPAFTFGAQSDPLSMYRQDIFTVPVNLTGVPALSVPMGEVTDGGEVLPVGVQYIAPLSGEARLFDLGRRTYDTLGKSHA